MRKCDRKFDGGWKQIRLLSTVAASVCRLRTGDIVRTVRELRRGYTSVRPTDE
jgi:hypothetical protein